eukprot:380555-Pleurochrysis_carterae.AAC.1
MHWGTDGARYAVEHPTPTPPSPSHSPLSAHYKPESLTTQRRVDETVHLLSEGPAKSVQALPIVPSR